MGGAALSASFVYTLHVHVLYTERNTRRPTVHTNEYTHYLNTCKHTVCIVQCLAESEDRSEIAPSLPSSQHQFILFWLGAKDSQKANLITVTSNI